MTTLETLKVCISVLLNRTVDRPRDLPWTRYGSSIHNPLSRHSSSIQKRVKQTSSERASQNTVQ